MVHSLRGNLSESHEDVLQTQEPRIRNDQRELIKTSKFKEEKELGEKGLVFTSTATSAGHRAGGQCCKNRGGNNGQDAKMELGQLKKWKGTSESVLPIKSMHILKLRHISRESISIDIREVDKWGLWDV